MKRISILLPILFALPVAVCADEGDLPYRTKGFYLGAGLGINQVEMKSGAVVIDSGDTTKKLLVGYRLPYSPRGINVALEGAYMDLGNAHDTPMNSTISLKIDGYELSALAYFPITRRWDMLAKAGAFIWDADLKGWAPPNGNEFTDSDSGTDLAWGFGAAMNTGTAFGLRLEIERLSVYDGAWVGLASGYYQFK
jgi:hypothetical protein